MAIFLQFTDRKVIPNWRSFKITAALGELDSVKGVEESINTDISKQLRDWELENSIGTAADLLGAAFLTHEKSDQRLKNASQFVLDNKYKASISLIKLAEDVSNPVLKKENPIDSMNTDDLSNYSSIEALNYIKGQIRETKYKLNNSVHNAIGWVELSRLYSVIGQNKQAMRAMEIAINLSPDNRYVLRSATRLFVHNDEADKAYHYLRKSPNTAIDPWLISAHIATTALLNKYQVNAKKAKAIVESRNYSYFNITELSSSIGTLEFEAGSIKDSKRFFEIAKKAPNDNSLAQLEWVAQKDPRFVFDELKLDSVPNSYEALAYDNFEKEHWLDSTNNSIRWLIDMPYSSRPVVLGSFVFSAYLDDQISAIKLCKLGLIANPNDITVLNNLMYAYLLSNDLGEASKASALINNVIHKNNNISDENTIMLQATLGLKAFREKNIEEGIRLYKQAIQNAQNIQSKDLELMASVNYLRELIINNCPEVEGEVFHISTIDEKQVQNHILRLKEQVMKLYMNNKKRSLG